VVQNDYTYSDTGNRLTNQVSDKLGIIRTEQYGYDELSRLTSVNYGDGETQSYSFDPMSNRTSKTVNGTTECYTHNPANMLLARAGSAFGQSLYTTYDGSTVPGATTPYTHDAGALFLPEFREAGRTGDAIRCLKLGGPPGRPQETRCALLPC
jgi:YD repeat-containing protein